MKQLGLAIHNYHDTHRVFPGNVGASPATPTLRGASWITLSLPYLDQGAAYSSWTFDGTDYTEQSNTFNRNWAIVSKLRMEILTCPSSPLDKVRIMNATANTQSLGAPATYPVQCAEYAGISGGYYKPGTTTVPNSNNSSIWTGYGWMMDEGVIVPWNTVIGPVSMAEVTDGTSNTLAVGENSTWLRDPAASAQYDSRPGAYVGGAWCAGPSMFQTGAWTENITVPRWPINAIYSGNTTQRYQYMLHAGLRSAHTGGAHGLMTDGSVRFLSENIDFNTVMLALCLRRDDTPVGEF